MLTNKTTLLIALIIAVVSAQSLVFDLKSIKYTQASDFWTVEVPCIGGSGQYNYQFDLPTGWQSQGNKIKIPASSTSQVNSQYAVRCRVKDSVKGDSLERSLVFKPFSQGNSYSLEVTDKQYFYGNSNLTSYSQQSTNVNGIDVLNRLGSLVQNAGAINLNLGNAGYSNNGAYYGAGSAMYGAGAAGAYGAGSYGVNGALLGLNAGSLGVNTGLNLNLGGIGVNANLGSGYANSYSTQGSSSYGSSYTQQQTISSSSSYNSSSQSTNTSISYNQLPSISQLDKYVANGDIVEIIQIIQLVVDSNVRCDGKASYLSDFLGRISAAIEVKNYTLIQLKSVVSAAIVQVQKLTVQIQTIKGQQADLKVDDLKNQLDSLVLKLKAAYDQYNNFSANSTSYDSEITSLNQEMNEINIKYTEVKNQLNSWTQTITSIDAQIADYQNKIAQLQQQRVSVQNNITAGQTFISDKDVRITQIKNRLTVIQTSISTASAQKDSLKKAYMDLQVTVDAAKAAYQAASDKFAQYDQQIASITVEIQRNQQLTSDLQIKQVSQCVENLQSAIKEIKASIDFVQYRCFNAPDIKVSTQCYQIPQTQWFSYVGQYYTNLADQIRTKIAQSFKNQIVEISSINIYSDLWKQNYGSCFAQDIATKAQNYKTDNTFGFASDFSCSSSLGSAESKSGVISNITANSVTVKGDDGNNYSLKLGSCSRFEGQGKDFVPKVGNNIVWKGAKNASSGYNLHSCTCY